MAYRDAYPDERTGSLPNHVTDSPRPTARPVVTLSPLLFVALPCAALSDRSSAKLRLWISSRPAASSPTGTSSPRAANEPTPTIACPLPTPPWTHSDGISHSRAPRVPATDVIATSLFFDVMPQTSRMMPKLGPNR